ncbi:MAG: hypothetical protein KIS61_09325 [Candidatus Eremiobacteraeota bacterium]|nr:hypothetical protein [Candidatus Eremiobacteraeota bacterium]
MALATTYRRVYATLTGPQGPINHENTLKVNWSVDRGWTWSCEFSQDYNIGHAMTETYTIELLDGYGNTLTSPPLVALQRSQRGPACTGGSRKKTLSGVDQTTFRMGKRNQSFPSFRATYSDVLMETLATRAGVTVSGLPVWFIGEEEVKGETLASAIQRLQKAVAYDAVIGTDGAIELTAWEDVGDSLDFPVANVQRNYDPSQVFTGVRLGKRTSRSNNGTQRYQFDHAGAFQMELQAPLTGPDANTGNDMAALTVGGVAFFDGDPNDPESGLVNFLSFPGPWGTLTVPPVGTSETGIATHMVVETFPMSGSITAYPVDALLIVTGTPYDEEDPPPAGVDLQFLYPVPNGNDPENIDAYDTSLGAWPSNQDAIDPIFQGYGQAEERYPSYLAKLNAPGDTLTMDGTFHLGPRPLRRYSFPVWDLESEAWVNGSYKVWSIDWDPGSIRAQITLVRAGTAA